MRVAAECVEQRGADAVPWLREQAELAEGLGQHETAEVWRECVSAWKIDPGKGVIGVQL
jgi:hypothetical protein